MYIYGNEYWSRPRLAWRRQLAAETAQKQLDLLDLDVQKKQLEFEGQREAQHATACEPLPRRGRQLPPTCIGMCRATRRKQ